MTVDHTEELARRLIVVSGHRLSGRDDPPEAAGLDQALAMLAGPATEATPPGWLRAAFARLPTGMQRRVREVLRR